MPSDDNEHKKKKKTKQMMVEEPPEPDMGCWEKWTTFPKTVFCIFGNEFCERFSYYGMRTVLTLYMVNVLLFSQTNAVAAFHGFISICYFTPLFGSILADGYVGKFHTILWVSLLYACGNIILAVAAIFEKGSSVHPALDLIGLLVIGIGTGGIKPCVSAFGGDQFKKGQERLLEAYFSIFYFSINAGAVISTFVTPIIRVTSCLGKDTCFPAAFGLPAALMVISVICFAAGSPWYRRLPVKENIIAEVAKAICRAIGNKSSSSVKCEHWMDHYMDNHDCHKDPKCTKVHCQKSVLVEDIKALLRVCVMYIPIPVFWALFDQQGSRWVLQGVEMDGRLGGVTLLPDQMPTLNALLILFFIPIFQGIVYPAVRYCGIDPTPLRRMTVGGFFAAASFIVAMFVQFKVNPTLPTIPGSNEFHQSFVNTLPCTVNVSSVLPFHCSGSKICPNSFSLLPGNSIRIERIVPGSVTQYSWIVLTPGCPSNIAIEYASPISTNVVLGKSQYTVLNNNPLLLTASGIANLHKAETGEGQFKLSTSYLVHPNQFPDFGNAMFWCYVGDGETPATASCIPKDADDFAAILVNSTPTGHFSKFVELKPRRTWSLWYANSTTTKGMPLTGKKPFWATDKMRDGVSMQYRVFTGVTFRKDGQGGIYVLSLTTNTTTNTVATSTYTVAADNTVSLLLQIPQYVIITAGEIMLSITGLEFSYSQAPLSMKSVVQAVWLLTVAIGDLLVLAIAEARIFTNVAWELLLFAILMVVVILIFMCLSIFWYEYKYFVASDEELDEIEEEAKLAAKE